MSNEDKTKTCDLGPEPTTQLSNSRLHWKDELDGDICSVIAEENGSDVSGSPGGQAPRRSIERSCSGTVLKRADSSNVNMTSFNSESRIFQSSDREYGSDNEANVSESPQWGWYVSTTPPSRDAHQLDPDKAHIVRQLRASYFEPPGKKSSSDA